MVAYPDSVGKSSILAMVVVAFGTLPAIASAEGESYAGVNPESESSENLPPKAEEIPEGVLMLTWPGFIMNEDGSTFFVQTSKEVRFGTRQSKGRFELVLHDIRVHLKTNYLPLETQFFDTPVTRATVQRSGKRNITMVFEMRKDVTPTVTQKKGKDGFNYVFVKFAK
jgi:hypothetical protein